MRRFLWILLLFAALNIRLGVAQSQQQTDVAELVDTVHAGGIDVFSDTTVVDEDGLQSSASTSSGWSLEDEGDFSPGLFFGAAILMFFLFVMLPLGLFFLFIVAVVLLVVFIVRRNRRLQAEEDEELNGPKNNQFYDIPMKKKLHRSKQRVIAGVCGGLAEYWDFDPTVVRIVYALLTIFTAFCGIPCYLVLWLLMPSRR